ncbi:PDZ domain-containing protein [Pseudomonas sp. zfem002]|uniref:PDZ domain-containing protein n=1 Tax=Pseudomonas sp. zfem002 TaxID=3078197 RepID=UPI002929D796|nr:PDZ domain-containing protein [Pseudomonas sp. zfem002]MDU9391824.1 PDZ domain-containing protein [Pseudomonas sp. zfem002]
MSESLGIALRLSALLVAGSLVSGCVAQAAHAVFSPMLTAASESLQTPESVGITPATWRGKSCQDLTVIHAYMADVVRKTAASGDAHMAKVHGWQLDAIQQVRNEQGCLNGNATLAAPATPATAPAPSATAQARRSDAASSLGLTLQPPGPELVKALGLESGDGAWIVSVAPESVAANAGLKPMDVILEVSGQHVSQPDDVLAITGKMRAGYQASLTVWRNRASQEVPLSIPAGLGTAIASAPTPAAPAQPEATPDLADARYCTAVMATQHTYGSTVSPVKQVPGAATDIESALKRYIARVQQAQPGAWADFTLNTAVCRPGAVVCSAEGKGPSGKTQNAFVFCHTTQAQADTQLLEMHKGDPQAVVVDWP